MDGTKFQRNAFHWAVAPWVVVENLWGGWMSRASLELCNIVRALSISFKVPSLDRGNHSITAYYCSSASHYSDVIMNTMACQITGVSIVNSTVCSGRDQRKHQSSASLAFVRGIHRWPMNSRTTRKMFPFDDVIMEEEYERENIRFTPFEPMILPHQNHAVPRHFLGAASYGMLGELSPIWHWVCWTSITPDGKWMSALDSATLTPRTVKENVKANHKSGLSLYWADASHTPHTPTAHWHRKVPWCRNLVLDGLMYECQ